MNIKERVERLPRNVREQVFNSAEKYLKSGGSVREAFEKALREVSSTKC